MHASLRRDSPPTEHCQESFAPMLNDAVLSEVIKQFSGRASFQEEEQQEVSRDMPE